MTDQQDDLPLASDEAHRRLYEIGCEALAEIEWRERQTDAKGGAEEDAAPPEP